MFFGRSFLNCVRVPESAEFWVSLMHPFTTLCVSRVILPMGNITLMPYTHHHDILFCRTCLTPLKFHKHIVYIQLVSSTHLNRHVVTVANCWKYDTVSNALVSPFVLNSFGSLSRPGLGHRATNYTKWMATNSLYQVSHNAKGTPRHIFQKVLKST